MKQFFLNLDFFKVYNWDNYFNSPLSEQNLVKIISVPEKDIKISVNTYTDVTLPGTARVGYIFMLEGQCNFTYINKKFELKKNEFCKIQSGDYNWHYKTYCKLIKLWFLDEIK